MNLNYKACKIKFSSSCLSSICLSIHQLSLCMFACIYLSIIMIIYIIIYLAVYLSIYLSVRLSVFYLSVSLIVSISNNCLCLCLYVRLISFCLYLSLCMCVFTYIPTCLTLMPFYMIICSVSFFRVFIRPFSATEQLDPTGYLILGF